MELLHKALQWTLVLSVLLLVALTVVGVLQMISIFLAGDIVAKAVVLMVGLLFHLAVRWVNYHIVCTKTFKRAVRAVVTRKVEEFEVVPQMDFQGE